MKKLFLLKVLFILLGGICASQVTLTGKITDKKTGEPLIGAAVYMPDLKTGEYTDDKGLFKISNLPATKVLVQVSNIGYKTLVSTVDLKTTSSANFEMEEDVMEVGGVVITAPSKSTEIKKTPAPLLILSVKSLDQNIHANIIDAIASLPGINAITTGPNVSKPSIHGLGYNRVLTLYDGIRQEGQQWGDEHGVEIDEYSVSRIEIIKGPSSLTYGTAYNESDASGYIGLNKKWGYSHLKFSIYDDLQEIPDGSRDSTTRKFTKQISENDVLPRVIVSDAELNTYKIAVLHQHVQHYRLYSINNFILGSGKLGVVLGYQQNVRREFNHPQAPGIPGLFLRLNSWTYDLKYSPDIKGWELTFGIDGMEQTNINAGTDFIIPDYNQFDIGTYINVKKSLHKFDLSAGFRFDSRSMSDREMFVAVNPSTGFNEKSVQGAPGAMQIFSGHNNDFTGISGSLGASCNATNKFLIKANIARGFRTPNIFEISANGVHPGTAIYQIGNSVFKPEFSLQEDLGIFYSSKYINWSVELFNNNITNYIFNQKLLNHLGKDSLIVKGNQTFKFVQSGADLNGLEGTIDIHPHPLDWLHFENSVSVIYAKNKGGNGVQITDSSRYLPSIPPFHWHSELRAEMKSKLRYISSWNANLEMDYYATQNRVYSAYNTETPTEGYTLFNISFGVEVANKSVKSILNFSILCNNIADIAYQSHLSRLKYFEQYPVNQTGRTGIFNMGRNIGFRLTVPVVLRS